MKSFNSDTFDADVIVVGAGPAGSVTAGLLAGRGRKVLLIDRCRFPRDKVCGDGIPPGTVAIMRRSGLGRDLDRAAFQRIDTVRVGSPGGTIVDIDFVPRDPSAAFLVAPRRRFDAMLQAWALRSGCAFLRGSVEDVVVEGKAVAGVKIRGGATPLRCRVVVGADGATSVVARSLDMGGASRSPSGAVAIRAYTGECRSIRAGGTGSRVAFYFDRRFLPGYAWSFPIGAGRANVGVYVPQRCRARAPRQRNWLHDALRSFVGDATHLESVGTWQLPCSDGRSVRRAFDGAVLVGDAGRMVDSLTGEGIHNAVASAEMAANAIADALDQCDTSRIGLAPYERECDRQLGPGLARALRVQHWLDRRPMSINALFVAASAAPWAFTWWINRVSTDFRVVRLAGKCRSARSGLPL